MEVSVTAFRGDLRKWLSLARAGEDVVITERGAPVARLSGIDIEARLAELVRERKATLPSSPRSSAPVRGGRQKPGGSVSELLVEQRR
jgi:prevent-host-death family protein